MIITNLGYLTELSNIENTITNFRIQCRLNYTRSLCRIIKNDAFEMQPGTAIEQTSKGQAWLVPFTLRGNFPILDTKFGNWKGPVLYDTGSAKTFIDYTFAKISHLISTCLNEQAKGVAGSVPIDHQARVDIKLIEYTFRELKLP